MITVDIRVLGMRFYLSLATEQEPGNSEEQAPTQLATPIRIGPGFMTWQQIRAAEETNT